MHKNSFLIFLLIVANSLTMVMLAQPKHKITDIDFCNIFNTQYTYIGIPIRDSVYIYAPPPSKSPTNWPLIDRLAIPKGTLAIDGNIRKSTFMTKEAIIFEESSRYDTLQFQTELPRIAPRLWIRGPHSTEAESYFLSGEKNVCYYREYNEREDRLVWQISDQLSPHLFKENRTQPVLTDTDGFHRLYSFVPSGGGMYIAALFDQRISFYRYPTVHDTLLGAEIVEPSELSFLLPRGTVTAFIYDFRYIAVVSQERVDFYDFDNVQKKWIKADGIPSLRFAHLNQDKK